MGVANVNNNIYVFNQHLCSSIPCQGWVERVPQRKEGHFHARAALWLGNWIALTHPLRMGCEVSPRAGRGLGVGAVPEQAGAGPEEPRDI